jgi:hypothetical protein
MSASQREVARIAALEARVAELDEKLAAALRRIEQIEQRPRKTA